MQWIERESCTSFTLNHPKVELSITLVLNCDWWSGCGLKAPFSEHWQWMLGAAQKKKKGNDSRRIQTNTTNYSLVKNQHLTPAMSKLSAYIILETVCGAYCHWNQPTVYMLRPERGLAPALPLNLHALQTPLFSITPFLSRCPSLSLPLFPLGEDVQRFLFLCSRYGMVEHERCSVTWAAVWMEAERGGEEGKKLKGTTANENRKKESQNQAATLRVGM